MVWYLCNRLTKYGKAIKVAQKGLPHPNSGLICLCYAIIIIFNVTWPRTSDVLGSLKLSRYGVPGQHSGQLRHRVGHRRVKLVKYFHVSITIDLFLLQNRDSYRTKRIFFIFDKYSGNVIIDTDCTYTMYIFLN